MFCFLDNKDVPEEKEDLVGARVRLGICLMAAWDEANLDFEAEKLVLTFVADGSEDDVIICTRALGKSSETHFDLGANKMNIVDTAGYIWLEMGLKWQTMTLTIDLTDMNKASYQFDPTDSDLPCELCWKEQKLIKVLRSAWEDSGGNSPAEKLLLHAYMEWFDGEQILAGHITSATSGKEQRRFYPNENHYVKICEAMVDFWMELGESFRELLMIVDANTGKMEYHLGPNIRICDCKYCHMLTDLKAA